MGYVGAAATKAIFTGLVILLTSLLFVDLTIIHPLAMLFFLVMTSIAFALLGFIVGIWAGNFEQLQMVPMLIITPLVFLGGTLYLICMLPPFWQTISLLNPVVYLVSAFRWCFFGTADVMPFLGYTMRGNCIRKSAFFQLGSDAAVSAPNTIRKVVSGFFCVSF